MIESRCGIQCSQCGYKDKVECGGCLKIEQPFWGSCPVKACCEEKKLENCGYCHVFPCEILNQFSYDKEQGDNGARIEKCKLWRKG